LLGQDVLVVHDEAHLEPAFQELLVEIQREQGRCREFRPFRVMQLTATTRAQQGEVHSDVITLTVEEKTAPANIPDPPKKPIDHLWRRIKARKALHLVPVGDEKKQLLGEIARAALRFADSARPVLVFAQSVEAVEQIVKQLRKAGQKVQQLTGTLRGLERDALPRDPIFARFLPQGDRPEEVSIEEGTVYLVCTSAGEVGVNISADHLVCDLTTFESMAQRFGRVNRFGDSADTEIHVVHPEQFPKDDPWQQARRKTLELLRQLRGDASPAALGSLDPAARAEAFSPEPTILPATDILFDCWALTTIRDKLPGRPPLEPYLHGVRAGEPPETRVAWREEVELRNQAVQWQRLRMAAERTKRELSVRQQAVVELRRAALTARGPLDLHFPVTRQTFAELAAPIIQRSLDTCREALTLCDLEPRQLRAVVLSGGSCFVPAGRQAVASFFGKPPKVVVPPERAVVMGAAMFAAQQLSAGIVGEPG
jgi:CRISPR-associated endonuclease/helicase Cas3